MNKIPSMLFAALLAVVSGIGVGFSSTSSADPGCVGDCFAARYECFAQCGGTTGGCAAACVSEYQACRAACNG